MEWRAKVLGEGGIRVTIMGGEVGDSSCLDLIGSSEKLSRSCGVRECKGRRRKEKRGVKGLRGAA
jgi:hypothetical protein